MNDLTSCTICSKEVRITLPGQYTDMLECGHIRTKVPMSNVMKIGAGSAAEAEKISNNLTQVKELPKIDGNDLVARALSYTSEGYEDFFNAENPIIEDMIKEHGKDNALLIFTAIHSHLSKVLFSVNRFRNLYYVKIEQLRKEVEDKAVKELIENHDYHYEHLNTKPKKIKTIGDKIHAKDVTNIDSIKKGLGGLTKPDGTPIDLMGFMAKLNFGKSKEKEEYKEGLDKIKENILKKD